MLPEKFVSRMKETLGADIGRFLSTYDEPSVRALRVNANKITAERFLSAFPYECEKIPYAENGYYVNADADEKIGSHPLHFAGAFYAQEPSAIAPVCAVDIAPDAKVLDACAAPGGKSSQIAERIPRGVLVSNEPIKGRAATLTGNVERQGFSNVIVTSTDPKTLAGWYRGVFDLVICDAPCSGEGMFRKDAGARAEWSEDNVKMCAARQKEILGSVADTVGAGGYLLYSTCTFSKEEDEDVVADFLSRHSDFSLADVRSEVAAATVGGIDMPKARRFYPHVCRGEGQFFALMKRSDNAYPEISYADAARKLAPGDMATVEKFFSDAFEKRPDGRLCAVNGTVSLAPDFPVPPAGVFCAGVKVGEIEKGRLVPHHQLFSAFGTYMRRRVDLTDGEEIRKYIGGDVLAVDLPDGWAAVTYLGCAVGGGKAVSGVLKNHYPKGLRRKI